MANTIGINNLGKSNAENQILTTKSGQGTSGKLSGWNGKEITFDYSAIKLTDDDKRYRMDIRKQADSLLSAANAITERFPPLFTQMITSYNNVREETQRIIDSKRNSEIYDQNNNSAFSANTEADTNRDVYISKEYSNNEAELNGREIEKRLDVDGIYNVISNFVNEINNMMEEVSKSGSYTARSTTGRIMSAIEDFGDSMADIGISYNTESGLEIDQDKLKKAIVNGQAEKVLTNEKGFTERIARIARDSMQRSDSFIEATSTGNDHRSTKNSSVNYNYITNATIDN